MAETAEYISLREAAEISGQEETWLRRQAEAKRLHHLIVKQGRRKAILFVRQNFETWWSHQRETRFLALARANPGKHWVYFIESVGWVKVGHSSNVPKRLSEIRLASATDVRLMGLMPGGRVQEQAYHKCLTELGIERRGEWFKTTPSDRQAIKELCDG